MNILWRDVKLTGRRPSYWLTLAAMSFLSGWIALVMTDMALSQADTAQTLLDVSVTRKLVLPFFSFFALLSLVLVAVLAGQLVAAERAAGDLLVLLDNGLGDARVLMQKLCALLLLMVPLALPLAMTLWGWSMAAVLDWQLVGWNLMAWVLLLLWSASLCLWLSMRITQSGLAALMGLVLLALLWLMGRPGSGQEWGKNWLQAFSPRYHFEWLQHGVVPISSLLFFIGGAGVLYALAVLALKKARIA